MKRIVCLLLVTVMLASTFLIACGEATETKGKTDTSEKTSEKTSEPTAEEPTYDEEKINTMKSFYTDYSYLGEVVYMEHSYGAPEESPTANQHPRVLFTSADVPTIKANLTNAQNARAYEEYAKLRDKTSSVDTVLAGGDPGNGIYEEIEAKAFAYAVEGNLECGYEAILLAKAILLNTEYMPEGYDIEDGDTRGMGARICTVGKVYDWCYDLLTAEEKTALYAGCQNVFAPYMEIGFPPHAEYQSSISSHSSEAQLLKDWMSLAIAVYDEYPNAYEFIGGKFYEEYVPFRNYYYQSNFTHQGSSYGNYRFGFDLYSAWLIKAMCGKIPYVDNMQNVVISFAYYILPNYSFMRMGDDGNGHRFDDFGRNAFLTANLFKNPVAKQLQLEYYYAGEQALDTGSGDLSGVEYLILNDPTIETSPVEELPLVCYNGSPLGQMLARTGWDRDGYKVSTSDDIVVMMKIGETNVGNHDHLDSGSFEIYYKGALAIDSSADGDGQDGRDEEYRYRTVAHNSLLIYGKQTKNVFDWGGQRYVEECLKYSKWSNKERKFGKVTGYGFFQTGDTLNYAYLAGDITAAYQSSSVKEVLRSMLFVPTNDETVPGLFFVFDKITSKKGEYEKVFLLHMREEPTAEGNVLTITRVEDGYNGKLVNQALLPADASYDLIGGIGKSSWVVDRNAGGDEAGFDVTRNTDEGWGRAEVSTVGNETDYFFNVMTIGAADTMTETPKATLIESDTVYGAKIMSCVAIFEKESARVSTEITFTVDGDETALTYCVAGLAAGEWTVTAGESTQTVTATEESGFLYFTAPAGAVKISPKA